MTCVCTCVSARAYVLSVKARCAHTRLCARARVYVCVCVRACARAREPAHVHRVHSQFRCRVTDSCNQNLIGKGRNISGNNYQNCGSSGKE